MVAIIFLLVIFVFCYFWVVKFVELMLLEDKYFPGPFDKIIWVVVFFLVVPLAPFAFRLWKFARTVEHASVPPIPIADRPI